MKNMSRRYIVFYKEMFFRVDSTKEITDEEYSKYPDSDRFFR